MKYCPACLEKLEKVDDQRCFKCGISFANNPAIDASQLAKKANSRQLCQQRAKQRFYYYLIALLVSLFVWCGSCVGMLAYLDHATPAMFPVGFVATAIASPLLLIAAGIEAAIYRRRYKHDLPGAVFIYILCALMAYGAIMLLYNAVHG